MPGTVLPNPTKGTGILRFSEEVYIEFKYDVESDDPEALVGYFHYGNETVTLLPELS